MSFSKFVREYENYSAFTDDKLIEIYNDLQESKDNIEYSLQLVIDELKERKIINRVQ